MTVYFNKTEHINDRIWSATVAPKCLRNGYVPLIGQIIHRNGEFSGTVTATTAKGELHIQCKYGFPCEGMENQVENPIFADVT